MDRPTNMTKKQEPASPARPEEERKFGMMAGAIYMRLIQMDAYAIAFHQELGIEPCRSAHCVRDFILRLNNDGIPWRPWLKKHWDQFGKNNLLKQDFADAMLMADPDLKLVGDKSSRSRLIKDMTQVGPPIWRELHISALAWDGSPASMQSIHSKVLKELPCGDCKQGWARINAEMPLRAATAQEFFAWTVEAHNRVNAKLGKPVMELAEALAMYQQAS